MTRTTKKATTTKMISFDKDIYDIGKSNAETYGRYVVENRAVPDFRDGCKPVNAFILYAALKDLGLTDKSAPAKTAKLVGAVMGNYHPHGDSSCAAAVASAVNCNHQTIHGSGNWGDDFTSSPPAAQRYCFTADTRIMSEKGLVRIGDIPKILNKDTRQTVHNIKLKVGSDKKPEIANKWLYSGMHDIYKVTLDKGLEVKATLNQPFLVLNENLEYVWKTISELNAGDQVCVNKNSHIDVKPNHLLRQSVAYNASNLKHYKLPTNMSNEFAAILGYMISEASIRSWSIDFGNSSKEVYDDYTSLLRKVFPDYVPKQYVIDPNNTKWSKKVHYTCGLNSTYICRFMEVNGLSPVKAPFKRVPECVFYSSKEEVASFLSTLYEGDGGCYYVSKPHAVGGNSSTIYYSSSSRQLMLDIQQLLLNYFGIISNITCEKNRTNTLSLSKLNRGLYRLTINGFDNIEKFATEINFRSSTKKERLQKILGTGVQYSNIRMNIPYVDEFGKKFLSAHLATNRHYLDETNEQIHTAHIITYYIHNIHKSEEAFRAGFESASELLKQHYPSLQEKLQNIADRDYWYAPIIKIQKLKHKQRVYDLTVPATHAFIANGIVSHNTECRLSSYGYNYIINKEYLKVVEFEDNYDGTLKQPIHLPALVPNVFINGTAGIAFGVSTNLPSFTPESLVKVLQFAPNITAAQCAEILEFNHGHCVMISSPEDVLSFMENGQGTIAFEPYYTTSEKSIHLKGVPHGFDAERMKKVLEPLDAVTGISDLSDKQGFLVEIKLRPDTNDVMLDEVLRKLVIKKPFAVNVIKRLGGNRAKFISTNVPELLNAWWKYRVSLERKYRSMLISDIEQEIHVLRVKLKAHTFKDRLFELLKAKLTKEQLVSKIAARLEIEPEDTKIVLDMTAQSLANMSQNALVETITKLEANSKAHLAIKEKPRSFIFQNMSKMLEIL